VLGKGGRQRALPLGRKTSVALDRYLRVRARHKFAHLEALPLGQRGALTPVSHRWQPAQLGQS
jgi:integrase/recombinase XerC